MAILLNIVFLLRSYKKEHKRNEEIREAATVQPMATHLMHKRLRWYGHVRRRDESHTTRTVLDMVVEGVRPRGRPKLRYMAPSGGTSK